MTKLDERLEAVRAEYGLAQEDFWQLPQNKQWLISHKALEVVAVKAGIQFDMPEIVYVDTVNGVAVITVQGHMDKRSEWSFGEVSPKNNKNAYPMSMAEKRAKDRVILKLAGIHGLVYSEDEVSDASKGPAEAYETKKDGTVKNAKGYTDGKMNSAGKRNALEDIMADMGDVNTNVTLDALYRAWEPTIKLWGRPGNEDEIETSWYATAMELFRAKRQEINDAAKGEKQ